MFRRRTARALDDPKTYLDAIHDLHVKTLRRVEVLEKRNQALNARVKHIERKLGLPDSGTTDS